MLGTAERLALGPRAAAALLAAHLKRHGERVSPVAHPVAAFAGRNGLSLSGEIEDAPFDMAITPGECSDGMSDRTYPFTVTLQVSGEQRSGCAWTESKPFSGPEHP